MDNSAKLNRRTGHALRLRLIISAFAVFAAWGLVSRTSAQNGSAAANAQPAKIGGEQGKPADSAGFEQPQVSENGLQYVGPDTYILLDSDGNPQPVLGMTYEDFLAAWRKLNQPPSNSGQPSYSIESMTFNGDVVGQRAEIDCRVRIRISSTERVRVPLGLVGAILQGEPTFESTTPSGDGKHQEGAKSTAENYTESLTYDSENGGYVANLAAANGNIRSIALHLVIPLQHDAAEVTLPLNCPRALSSRLMLRFKTRVSEARVSTGTIVTQQVGTDGATAIEVAGPTGLFRLTWQSNVPDASAIGTVLNALGSVHITVDGRGVRTDARLTVRSYGGTFEQFRVRLPRGAQLVQATSSDVTRPRDIPYRIRMESEPSTPVSDTEKSAGRIVVVDLAEKQQGPVVVDLTTQQSVGQENQNQDINLAGFEVIGAVRQFGDVSVTISDDWQARWELGSYVRQVDPTDLDSALQSTNPTAAFQYDRQPWSLLVRVARRELRVHVTPSYALECLPEEARLGVKLTYQVFGSRAFEFRVELNGWEITGDPVESGSLVDQDRIVVTPEGTLLLPLSQASSRRAEVSFTLRRTLNRDDTHLELPLPVPAADSIGTGELTVHAPPDIDFLPDLPGSTGLSATASTELADNSSVEGATNLRYRTLLPAAVFVADRTSRTQEISTESISKVRISQSIAQVETRINYLVRFEPIAELKFNLPAEISPESADIGIQLLSSDSNGISNSDGQGVALHPISSKDQQPSGSTSTARLLRTMLPRPGIGKFAILIRYQVELPKVGSNRTKWTLPLMSSSDGRSTTYHAVLEPSRGIALELDAEDESLTWKKVTGPAVTGSGSSTLSVAADQPELSLPLSIQAVRTEAATATVVDRIWMQSWLAREIEQDRAVFRVRSAGSQLTIELPPDVASGEVEALVDRQPAEVISRALGRVVVRLRSDKETMQIAPQQHTLELRWRRPNQHGLLARHRFTPPQIEEGSTALSQFYWQIILPSDEHVVNYPNSLVPAHRWQWLGAFWGRQPWKTQAALEKWAGASEQLEPTDGQNQYLYTGLLPVATIELTVAPRWLIVLVASAILLGAGVVWLNVSNAIRAKLAAAACLGIFVLAAVFPTAGLLAAQAAVLGGILFGLALLLSGFRSRHSRVIGSVIASPSSQRVMAPRHESIPMPPFIATASTAPTASLQMSEPER